MLNFYTTEGFLRIFGTSDADLIFSRSDINSTTLANLGEGDDLFLTARAPGNYNVSGDEGNDTLSGGAAEDFLQGGRGDDHLIGYGGRDILTGGEGADTFVLLAGEHRAQIIDFSFEEGDTLDLPYGLDVRFEGVNNTWVHDNETGDVLAVIHGHAPDAFRDAYDSF